jgi:hypothetical protein
VSCPNGFLTCPFLLAMHVPQQLFYSQLTLLAALAWRKSVYRHPELEAELPIHAVCSAFRSTKSSCRPCEGNCLSCRIKLAACHTLPSMQPCSMLLKAL